MATGKHQSTAPMMEIRFDSARLDAIAEGQRADYLLAQPFPHAVIDDFLPQALALAVLAAFPQPTDEVGWDRYAAPGFEIKLATSSREKLSVTIMSLIDTMNSDVFLRFVEKLTGIEDLLPDPQLRGGGVHLVGQGGQLGIHADFNWHEVLQAHRRINLLLYFNQDWQDDYRGDLELWSTDASHCVKTIAPVFNRAVVFNTRSDTFHGHPQPLAVPDNVFRRAIAMYYYTRERPLEELTAPHNTRYKGLHLD